VIIAESWSVCKTSLGTIPGKPAFAPGLACPRDVSKGGAFVDVPPCTRAFAFPSGVQVLS
jgi:hypothetical protein